MDAETARMLVDLGAGRREELSTTLGAGEQSDSEKHQKERLKAIDDHRANVHQTISGTEEQSQVIRAWNHLDSMFDADLNGFSRSRAHL